MTPIEAIEKHLPALKKMAAQIICPKDNTFSRMVQDFEMALNCTMPTSKSVVYAINDNQAYFCPKCSAEMFTSGFSSKQIAAKCKTCDTVLILRFNDYKLTGVSIHPPGPPNPPRAKWQECG